MLEDEHRWHSGFALCLGRGALMAAGRDGLAATKPRLVSAMACEPAMEALCQLKQLHGSKATTEYVDRLVCGFTPYK